MTKQFFKDKIAIITGGGSGIGKALCETLGQQGAIVIATDVMFSSVKKVVSEINQNGGQAIARLLNVSDSMAFQKLIEDIISQHGRLDFLFNNAGITLLGEVYDMTLEHWHQIINVNFMGVVHGVSSTYPVMVKQGFGHIVNIASTAGLVGYPSATAYASTKSAVIGLSTSLRSEGKHLGVNVSVVCPGYVNTNIFNTGTILNADMKAVLDRAPLKAVEPKQIVQAILRGVIKNKELILFPFSAKLLWWLSRIHPGLLNPIRNKLIQDLRRSST